MIDPARLDAARKAVADLTAELEDAALIASEAQSVRDFTQARKACSRLIGHLFRTRRNVDRLRRQIL